MDNGDRNEDQLPGERFVPMEDELLLCYLKPLVHGMEVPGRNIVVFDCDLYGNKDPWEIWDKFAEKRTNDLRKNKDLFFFTSKKKKTLKDSRIDRTVGSGGTWKEESGKKVRTPAPENRVIGYKKTFGYKNPGSPYEGCWIMHEYELHPSQLVHKRQETNQVLCVLRKKIRQQGETPENAVPDDGTNNLISNQQQPKRQRIDPSTSSAPSQPLEFHASTSSSAPSQPLEFHASTSSSAPSQSLEFDAVKGEWAQQPPWISNPYAQPVPLQYEFPGEVEQYSQYYWAQQFGFEGFPSVDEVKMVFSDEMDENLWQETVSQPGTTPHPHTSGTSSTDGVHHNY